jgi:ribonuclease D
LGNRCYLFDLLHVTEDNTKFDPFPLGLKAVLEDRGIIKVFHDFCEDTSALVKQYQVHCDGVFDTQIAHRKLVGDILRDTSDPRDMNISLNALL